MARREVVVHRGWVSDEGFVELLSLAQVMPGPNLTNMAVLIGSRLRGPVGAVLAFVAMMTPGYLIVMAIAAIVLSGANQAWISGALRGCAAGAVGLSLANALQMTARHRRNVSALIFIALSALGVAVVHASLIVVLIVLVPFAWVALGRRRRRA